ncbi:hypothetical protein BU25DRAFT_457598 [Macroventuria anomochaeta]|uniref:Uncharacterized protein n=1 Tax=Macroventuria anomochaeta TaxID=301207 RepID=A0ACB6S5A0_9PLEO|nr:uncharacterized protein BU25DRAFT_457598 [Macroventuria anomochaeta]KAF2628810.1 hypothetical protein BU25DRAFT_457598 [Macroventuria anomochaeta]
MPLLRRSTRTRKPPGPRLKPRPLPKLPSEELPEEWPPKELKLPKLQPKPSALPCFSFTRSSSTSSSSTISAPSSPPPSMRTYGSNVERGLVHEFSLSAIRPACDPEPDWVELQMARLKKERRRNVKMLPAIILVLEEWIKRNRGRKEKDSLIGLAWVMRERIRKEARRIEAKRRRLESL